jgi:polar amino acid transport system substrate-binding protein
VLLRHLFALCLATLLCAGAAGLSDTRAQQSSQALTIGFRLSAPYVLQQPDGVLSGLEYDLVMLAANAAGLSVRPQLAPFGRLPEDFRRQAIDAFAPASPAMTLPGCISDTVLVYRNLAFSLQRRSLTIATPADLAGLDVTGFQNAGVILGPGVAQLAGNPSRYREVANQMLQVRALFSGRTDVVLAEHRIFRFMMRSPDAGVDTTPALTEHELFPTTPYGVAFQQPVQCLRFNQGLAAIRRNGVYDEVLRRWDSAPQAKSGTGSGTAPPFG